LDGDSDEQKSHTKTRSSIDFNVIIISKIIIEKQGFSSDLGLVAAAVDDDDDDEPTIRDPRRHRQGVVVLIFRRILSQQKSWSTSAASS